MPASNPSGSRKPWSRALRTGFRCPAGWCWPPTRVGPRRIAAPGLPPALEPAAQAVGEFVLAWRRECSARPMCRPIRVCPDRAGDPGGRDRLSARVPGPDVGRAGRDRSGRRRPGSRDSRRRRLSVLRAVLEPGAIALDNALRMQRAEALSVTDDLTQLYNSRYLSQVLRRETKRASRSGRPLSLLFIDLDGFKAINDTHGHLCGQPRAGRGGRRDSHQRPRDRHRGPVRRRRVRAGAAGHRQRRCRRRSASASATGSPRTAFLRKDGLDIKLTVSVGVATLPDVAATAERADPGRRRGDVLGQGARQERHARGAPDRPECPECLNAKTVKTAERDWTFG